MKYSKELTKEIERLIKEEFMDCSVDEFQDEVDWLEISWYQKLSKEFIEEFKSFITKQKRGMNHGKYFGGKDSCGNTPKERAFYSNNKQYGEQISYEYIQNK